MRALALALVCISVLGGPAVSAEPAPGSIDRLLEAAWNAYSGGRYASPDNDCVLFYTRKILSIDPRNHPAQSLEDKVADYLKLRAGNFESAGDFASSLKYYRSYLKVRPEDGEIQKKVNSLEERAVQPADAEAPIDHNQIVADFNAAEKLHDTGAWRYFLEKYPDTEFTEYAMRQLAASLAPPVKPGSLRVGTRPEKAAARVFVNGEDVGPSPVEIASVPPAVYTIDVKAIGFDDYRATVQVQSDQKVIVNALLRPAGLLLQARAIHHHRVGKGCTGEIRVFNDRIEFLGDGRKHSALLLAEDVSFVDLSNPYLIRITSARTRSDFTFELAGEPLSGEIARTILRWTDE